MVHYEDIDEFILRVTPVVNANPANIEKYYMYIRIKWYERGLPVVQRFTRRWLFRRQVKEWVQRVRALLVFKRYAVFLPDDILWMLLEPSLYPVKKNHPKFVRMYTTNDTVAPRGSERVPYERAYTPHDGW